MDGTLYLAVNDIYLDDKTAEKYKDCKKDLPNINLPDSTKNLEDIWFDDNIGEILLNISVYRNDVSDSKLPFVPDIFPRMYRETEAALNNSIDYKMPIIIVILLILDFLFGNGWQNIKKITTEIKTRIKTLITKKTI